MNKIVKNLVLAFTIICALVLVVFCIELIIINSGSDNLEEETVLSNGDPDGDAPEEQEIPNDVPPGSEGLPSDGNQQGEPNTQPKGKEFELEMLVEEMVLALLADEEMFEYAEVETGWEFRYTGAGNALLRINLDYIPPQGARSIAQALLDPYVEDIEPTIGGVRQIRGSSLRGIYVAAEKDGETFEAWLHGPLGSGVSGHAVAFIINYQNDTQKDALSAILDTLDMVDLSEQETEDTQDDQDGEGV